MRKASKTHAALALLTAALAVIAVVGGTALASEPRAAAPPAVDIALPDGTFRMTLDCTVQSGQVKSCVNPNFVAPTSPSSSPTASPTVTQTPTPSPTVTATPTPTATTPTGWPNADTTGVPLGTALTIRNGGLTISQDNAVVSGLDVRGCVYITGRNVTFRDSRVTCANGFGVRVVSLGGVVLDGLDISCAGTAGKGVVGEGFTLRSSDVSGCEDAVYVVRNANVLDSYLHDLYGGGADPHTDVVQVVNNGDNVLIEGNYLSNRTSRATSGYMGDGPGMDNIVINRNFIEAGGYAVYCSSSGVGNAVTNNTIDALGYGPWYPTCYRSGIVRTGNTIL